MRIEKVESLLTDISILKKIYFLSFYNQMSGIIIYHKIKMKSIHFFSWYVTFKYLLKLIRLSVNNFSNKLFQITTHRKVIFVVLWFLNLHTFSFLKRICTSPRNRINEKSIVMIIYASLIMVWSTSIYQEIADCVS